jgi:DNA-binding transcriptional ArsR family regulator
MAYSHTLQALGDPTRRLIFERLGEHGPMAVGQLAAELPVSRPAVSQHLRVLKQAGLVRSSSSGTRRLYIIDPAGIGELREYLDIFWQRALAVSKKAAEEPHTPRPTKEMRSG